MCFMREGDEDLDGNKLGGAAGGLAAGPDRTSL